MCGQLCSQIRPILCHPRPDLPRRLKGKKSTKALELELQLELRRMELQAQAQSEERKLQMQLEAEERREQRHGGPWSTLLYWKIT